PAVDIKPVPRGRRIEGASISTPTMAWGGGDGTSITPFTTTSMVAAIDTTIFTVDGAIEIGRDFLSDSAIDVGATLTALVGDRLMNELDKKIANGNGTTEIEGLFQKSGVATATPDNTTTGPPTLDDYYDLLFGVAKQYRKPAYNCAFVSNDTSFRRTRGIKIDVGTTDQRAALAPNMDASFFNTYSTLGWPHKIENNLANGYAGFFALKKYRLYRRLGMEMRFIDGGTTLAKANTILLVYRARYGGQLMDANAGIKWTNGQS
ncbi:MAG: phage major capsid protein, partial [Planctomycetaceae bacterium]|nr:phage major capsid protein [Planctomycetaceae bacterium]